MTYHAENNSGTGDRPALEIEITPEMIAAGVEAFCLFQRGDPPEDVVAEVYRRMALSERSVPALGYK